MKRCGSFRHSVVTIVLSVGKQNGQLVDGAMLDGRGKLVLSGAAAAKLPDVLIKGKTDMSLELWIAPTAKEYNWAAPVRLGSADDWFTFVFRTYTTHRAEIAVNRHNEDIQRSVPVEQNRAMHVVVTFDGAGGDGKDILCCYRDGELRGNMTTSLRLSDIEEGNNRLGPFSGVFDEFRIYDYPLTPGEVANNYNAGTDRLTVSTDP